MIDQEDHSPICIYMLENLGEANVSVPQVPAAQKQPAQRDNRMLGSNANPLSKRELEVLRCLAQGVDPPAISERLAISESTVRNHIQNILTKFGVHSRVEAVVRAYRQKMVE
jgi:DNA-binding NarL/FixJ family response regulator